MIRLKRSVVMMLTGCLFLLATGTDHTHALEYQWKFVIPAMNDRPSAVRVFEVIEQIPGVLDIDVNIDRNWLMFLYDDEKTDMETVKSRLQESGFSVQRTMLLEEPREGIMN